MTYQLSEADLTFKQQFEACEILPADFSHTNHLRLAYAYLTENDPETSTTLMRESILRFLDHYGIDKGKYHETITKAWILAVNHFMHHVDGARSAHEFIEQSPKLLEKDVMLTHYSAEVLFSDNARKAYIEPNLSPIPLYN